MNNINNISKIKPEDKNNDINIKNISKQIEEKYIDNLVYSKIKPEDKDNDLQNLLFPLYYLFDKNINEIGSETRIRTYLRSILKLDDIFKLDKSNLLDISYGNHATILYKLDMNNKKYIYYSNSGLGINNNYDSLINGIKYVVPKIYEVNNIKRVIIFDFIKFFIETISSNYKYKNTTILEDKIYDSIYDSLNNYEHNTYLNISNTKEDIKKIYKDIKDDPINKTYLCYALLEYILNKNPTNIKECFISDIIGYNNINDIVHHQYMKELSSFFQRCKSNEGILLTRTNLVKKNNKNNIIYSPFQTFIESINSSIESRFNTPLLNYVKGHFLIKQNEFGLLNIIQSSGSCTFYSYFNLGINILLLSLYFDNSITIENKINKYINNCLKFHNSMIYLLCISNDTLCVKSDNYSVNNFFLIVIYINY